MNKLNLLFLILLLPFIILIRIFTPKKDSRGRKLTNIIEDKYPKCKIINIAMQYDNRSSDKTISHKEQKVKGAVVVIENNCERRTLHLTFSDDNWNIINDVPDSGNDLN